MEGNLLFLMASECEFWPESVFQRQFSESKVNDFFFFFSLKNIKVGDHVLLKHSFKFKF